MAHVSAAVLALCVVCAASAFETRARDQGSVILKVVEMLEANRGKVAKDLASEEKEAAAYAEFCDEETTTKSYAIKDGERKIGGLNAAIEDAEAQIKALDNSISGLGAELASKDREIDAAEAERKEEKAEFEANEKVLEASVEQLEKAIAIVKHEEAAETTPVPEAFLQSGRKSPRGKNFAKVLAEALQPVLEASWASHSDAQNLKALLQQEAEEESERDSDLSLEATTQKNTGASQSVVQTLEDMKTKAEESVSAARQEEMKDNFNYQMIKQSLTAARANAGKKLADAKTDQANLKQAAGKSKQELAGAKKAKISDKMYLSSLTQDCKNAAEEWNQRQKEAKGEMAALTKAKELLSEKVKMGLAQQSGDFLGDDAGEATGSEAEGSPVRKRLIAHLKGLGDSLKSYALAELAGAAVADPFAKIRGIVEQMIAKITAQANEEATHKTFCDEEKKKGTIEKDEKSMRADELKNRVDTATSKKALLVDYIKELQAEIAKIDSSTSEATTLRSEQHASFLVASKDFKDSAQAIEDAIRTLRDYYDSIALVQRTVRHGVLFEFAAPQSGAADAIVGILEESQEEFTKMYMESNAEEKEAADAYKKLTDESKVSRASKAAEVKASESEIKSLEVAISDSGSDYKLASQELDAVMEYLEKLKPQCEAKAMTYEEKKSKREAEIEGLKQALSIIDAPELVQTRKHF